MTSYNPYEEVTEDDGPICACCGSEGVPYEMKPLPPYLNKVCGGCYKAISIHLATTCPIEELPLMINHPLEKVKTIVNARLTLKKLDL